MFLESSLCHYQRQSLVELVESYDEPIATACGATTTLELLRKQECHSNPLRSVVGTQTSCRLRAWVCAPRKRRSDASQPTASFLEA